ncbi:MAG: LON peptidase substrate-binding domain-containing protein [Myxococcales bacterium]|nr:LON peptidase substrate-binding domain-containing protein [Myxococcales bacterium]
MIEHLPVLVVRYPALLPEGTAFLAVVTAADAALARAARDSEEPFTFAAFMPRDVEDAPASAARLMPVGCAAVVEEVVIKSGQLLGVRARGLARVGLIGEAPVAAAALMRVGMRVLDAHVPAEPLQRAQLARVRTRVAAAGLAIDAAVGARLAGLDDPGHFADLLAAQLDGLTLDERLQLLVTHDSAGRLALVDRLVDARASAPTREFGRVWAALRGPAVAVPAQASLSARARDVDTTALVDASLRRVVEDMARDEPIRVLEIGDSHEREHRRESLAQLTAAVRSLTALRGCGDPDDREDAAAQAEIAAAVALLLTVASMEHEEMSRTP